MEQFIITVARETGSGGHNITRKLSAALGGPTQTARSASWTWRASASAVEYTATVSIPSS